MQADVQPGKHPAVHDAHIVVGEIQNQGQALQQFPLVLSKREAVGRSRSMPGELGSVWPKPASKPALLVVAEHRSTSELPRQPENSRRIRPAAH